MKDPMAKKKYRNFGFTMAMCISLIFGVLIPLIFNTPISMVPLYIAGLFFITACLSPETIGIIYHPWMIFGNFLHRINTCIILFIIFYVVFTPWAILLKIIGKDFMERKLPCKSDSYWKTSTPQQEQNMKDTY